MRRGPRRLTTILWILLALFITAGFGSLGAYLVLSRRSVSVPLAEPMPAWIASASVESRLALLGLAGWPDSAVIDRALIEGEPETALSVLAYSVTLSDRVRGGALLRVAAAYAERKDANMAGALYHKAETVAVLSPDLGDWSRAELLFQAGLGLLDLGERKEALALLEQAKLVTQVSAEMKPAQRQQMATRLSEALQRAGAKDTRVNVTTGSQGEEDGQLPALWTIPLGAVVGGEGEGAADAPAAALPAGLRQAQEARRQKAEALVSVLELQAGPPKPALVADLANALLAEEAALASLAQCQDCSALSKAEVQLQWAMLKWRAAQQSFGLSLVTTWDTAGVGLAEPVSESWSALYALRRMQAEQALAGEDPVRLNFSLWRGQVLVGALGLSPQFDVAAGYDELLNVADQDPHDWVIQMSGAGKARHFTLQAR